MRAYVRSNKWAIDPAKLAQFSEKKLVGIAADEYLKNILQDEIPQGVKKYLEYKLFPWNHLKVGCGVLLSTAHLWLYSKVFCISSTRKACILMVMTDLIWLIIARSNFCQL